MAAAGPLATMHSNPGIHQRKECSMKPTRLVLAALGAAVMAAVTAASALAGGVPFQSPGQYRFSSIVAGASFMGGTPDNPSFTDVTVQQGTFIAHYTGSNPSLVHQTVVQLTMFQPTTGNFGTACYVVPDSALTMSSDLSTATLATTLTPDRRRPTCCRWWAA
jgi:hypothetical protein